MFILLWSGDRSGDRVDQVYPQHAQIEVWLEVKQDESIVLHHSLNCSSLG